MAASDDMVREILARVKDLTTLYRCAMVCKGWRGLIVADDYFLVRRCLPENVCSPSAFSGFITQLGSAPPCFVPAPCRRPMLGNGRRFLSPFFSGVPARLFDHAVPLASRHGLLLVRLDLQRAAGIHPDRSGVVLAVCDLLSGTVQELPRLEHYWDFEQGRKVSGYALLTAVDCSSSNDDGLQQQHPSRFFKVLLLTIEHGRTSYDLHVFSSAADESGWDTRSGVVEDDQGRCICAMLRQHNAVVLDGAAHWLLWGLSGAYTLHVSAETGHVSSTQVMNSEIGDLRCRVYDKPYLTSNDEGKLMVLTLRRDGRLLEISTSHDNGRSFHNSMLML
jgi:hypothetical protein